MKKGQEVKDSKAYLARKIIEQFPHASKKELGKILFQKYPLRFSSEEVGRQFIRFVTGTCGSQTIIQTDKYKGPLSIPKGQLNDYSHYTVKGERVGILSDIHIPYHDSEPLDISVRELQKQKIDTLILNGDIIDCYQESNFVKNPTKDSIKIEIEILCHFIKDLQKAFRGAKIIYKFGNHEDRWEKYLMSKAPSIWGFECFELDNLIKIEYLRLMGKPLEIDFVKNKRIIDIGHLAVVHGHEFGEMVFSPVNAARGFYLRGKANVLGGHLHQTSEHTENNMNGKVVSAWSVGCLCDLHPEYRPLNKWNHGYAFVIHSQGTGEFEVHNKKIIKGKVY